ncbi:MAG TPA: hypothetical protein VF653_10385 [Methylomirabilota bacterium]
MTVKKTKSGCKLVSRKGKTLGTHKSCRDAYRQEYAIKKSKERRGR